MWFLSLCIRLRLVSRLSLARSSRLDLRTATCYAPLGDGVETQKWQSKWGPSLLWSPFSSGLLKASCPHMALIESSLSGPTDLYKAIPSAHTNHPLGLWCTGHSLILLPASGLTSNPFSAPLLTSLVSSLPCICGMYMYIFLSTHKTGVSWLSLYFSLS